MKYHLPSSIKYNHYNKRNQQSPRYIDTSNKTYDVMNFSNTLLFNPHDISTTAKNNRNGGIGDGLGDKKSLSNEKIQSTNNTLWIVNNQSTIGNSGNATNEGLNTKNPGIDNKWAAYQLFPNQKSTGHSFMHKKKSSRVTNKLEVFTKNKNEISLQNTHQQDNTTTNNVSNDSGLLKNTGIVTNLVTNPSFLINSLQTNQQTCLSKLYDQNHLQQKQPENLNDNTAHPNHQVDINPNFTNYKRPTHDNKEIEFHNNSQLRNPHRDNQHNTGTYTTRERPSPYLPENNKRNKSNQKVKKPEADVLFEKVHNFINDGTPHNVKRPIPSQTNLQNQSARQYKYQKHQPSEEDIPNPKSQSIEPKKSLTDLINMHKTLSSQKHSI